MKKLNFIKKHFVIDIFIILFIVFALTTFFPLFDQDSYSSYINQWEQTTPSPPVVPPKHWPKTDEEHLAVLLSTCSDRETITDGSSLTLVPDSIHGLLNDEVISLAHPPVMDGDALLLPAEEVLTLLGGTIRYCEESGAIRLYLRSYNGKLVPLHDLNYESPIMWIGMSGYSLEGESKELSITEEQFSMLGTSCPQFINGIIYIPASYLCQSLWLEGQWLSDGGGYRIFVYATEIGAGGVVPGRSFQSIPFDMAQELHLVRGDLLNPGNGYFYNIYGNDDIRLYCIKDFWPYIREPWSAKRIIGFKLLSPRYTTPRGIRIGDSVQRVLDKYSLDGIPEGGVVKIEASHTVGIKIIIKDDVVVSIQGYTEYS